MPSSIVFRGGEKSIYNPAGNTAFLDLKNIVKSYDREVLNVRTLAFERGKIYGIIGPSGAGKTTLLRIINLLTEPDRGTIYFEGRPIPPNGPARLALQRQMTLVFQKPLLFSTTVRENIAYGLRTRGYSREEIKKRVSALLEQIGLPHMKERHAGTLSGGEAQRVALARAVAFKPKLLLLDEPTANLDPANVELMEKMILQLKQTMEVTIIIVTHNIFQARRLTDETIFLYDGQVVETGETSKMFNVAPGRAHAGLYRRADDLLALPSIPFLNIPPWEKVILVLPPLEKGGRGGFKKINGSI
ncbi:MAG: phosphate ABC transporter ATP-binding protein [Dethiobacteria bacterium]